VPNNTPSARVAEQDISRRESHLSDIALFFRKFVEKGRDISSAVPSSRTMALRALSMMDMSRPGTIVELGAGTGAITEQIVERLRPHHRFFAVENDADFVQVLRRRFPDQTVLHADAASLKDLLAMHGVHRVRYVVSALPTPALPRRSIVRLHRWIADALEPDGLYVQITIAPLMYGKFYRRLFDHVSYRMVWRNIPPGGVYRCDAPRATLHRR
jgi:phosphatidylethanolamine/phosphatidyl-N-methylethanolamine N-methyltransferase